MSRYRMLFDYHTHTVYSHGKGSIEDNVKVAVAKGLKAIAIADHGSGHLTYGVKRSNIPVMRREIDGLQDKYPEIDIYLSVEANIIYKSPYIDVKPEELKYFDFIIGGYHYGIPAGHCIPNWLCAHKAFPSKGLLVANTDMTVKAIYENELKILTHPGDKGPFDIGEIAKACAARGTWMEISTWHPHLTVEEIRQAAKEDVSFIISSDAHSPNRVGSFEGGIKRALEAGLDLDRIVNIEVVK